MIHLNMLKLIALAPLLVGAAPASESSGRAVTTVIFQNLTISYYTDAFIPAEKSQKLFGRDNRCGASDFEDGPPPFATVTDCGILRDFMYSHPGSWVVQPPGPAANTRIVTAGTCQFGASTTFSGVTLIGNEDVGDLTRDSINKKAAGGVVCAQGNMQCQNTVTQQASVFWALYHTP